MCYKKEVSVISFLGKYMKKFTIKSLTCILVFVSLNGCTKLNMENYDRLKMGMEQSEVEDILGSASDCSKNLGSLDCYWGDKEGKHINIKFVAGNAVMFSHQGIE